MLNGLQCYARDCSQYVHIKSLIPLALTEWVPKRGWIHFLYAPIGRAQVYVHCKKIKVVLEPLLRVSCFPPENVPAADETAPSHALGSTVPSSVCLCDASAVIYIVWRCLIFCRPSHCAENHMCGQKAIVFTGFPHARDSWRSLSNIPIVNPKQSNLITGI